MPLFQYVKRIQEIANVRRCLLSCPYQILTRAPQMPNQVSALTTALISKAKPEPAPYEIRDTKMKGLVLRVQPSGHKSLNYEYRVKGRKKRTSLGSATILTLNQARALAIELQNSANTGIDVNDANDGIPPVLFRLTDFLLFRTFLLSVRSRVFVFIIYISNI